MRVLILVAAFTALPLRGEEPPPTRVREALHALIMESLPQLPPVAAPVPAEIPEPAIRKVEAKDDVVVLEPIVVVSESVRAVSRLIARQERQKEAEKFAPIKGGTIYHKGRLKIGTWAGEDGGLNLVKIAF